MNCFLCLEGSDVFFNTCDEFQQDAYNFSLIEPIAKYFTFKPSTESASICETCFNIITPFHVFCLQIEETHNKVIALKEKLNAEAKKSNDLNVSNKNNDNKYRNKKFFNNLSDDNDHRKLDILKTKQSEIEKKLDANIIPKEEIDIGDTELVDFNATENAIQKNIDKLNMAENYNNEHKKIKEKLQCNQCDKTFSRIWTLKQHQAYHTPKETWKFKCEECEKIFPSKFYLSSHKQFSHNSIPTKVCYVCGKVVPTNRYIRHMQMHDSNYKVEKVECEICKVKLNKKYINIHRQHHKEAEKEEFYCTICNHKSPNRRALYCHMRYTHAEQRNHECQVCHKTFKRKLALRQHMGTHTGDNLYSCPYCPKTFTYDSNFYIHKKKEHPKEIEIEKQNKKRTNFKQHMEKWKEAEEIVKSTKSLDIVHEEQIV